MCESFAKSMNGGPFSISGKPAVEMPVADNKCAFNYAQIIPFQPPFEREIILDHTTTGENQHSSCQSFSWPSSRNQSDNTIVFRAFALDSTLPGTNSSHTTHKCHGRPELHGCLDAAAAKADENVGDASTR